MERLNSYLKIENLQLRRGLLLDFMDEKRTELQAQGLPIRSQALDRAMSALAKIDREQNPPAPAAACRVLF